MNIHFDNLKTKPDASMSNEFDAHYPDYSKEDRTYALIFAFVTFTSIFFIITGLLNIIYGVIISFPIVFLVYKATMKNGLKIRDKSVRLYAFAKANNFIFEPRVNNPSQFSNGMIFNIGYARFLKDLIMFNVDDSAWSISNYYYTTGSGKSTTVHGWGFMHVKLERKVPHMVLDSIANNLKFAGFNIGNLPGSLTTDQTLQLEGDFNKYFTLYVPIQYERDALYVFTPDLMQLVIDTSSKYDIEVVDDDLYVYSSLPFDLTDVELLKKLMLIGDTVGDKTIGRTQRYSDQRVNDTSKDIVSGKGQRLNIDRNRAAKLVLLFVSVIFIDIAITRIVLTLVFGS